MEVAYRYEIIACPEPCKTVVGIPGESAMLIIIPIKSFLGACLGIDSDSMVQVEVDMIKHSLFKHFRFA